MWKHKHASKSICCSILLISSIFILVRSVGSTNGSPYTTTRARAGVGTNPSFNTHNPSGYASAGSTSWVLDSVSNATSSDSLNMVFRSYFSGTDIEDYVDINTSNVDSTIDKGAHSNFTAQQYAPDSVHDILTEEKTSGGTEVLNLYVNADDENKTEWSRVGTSPYLDAVDYNSSYVYASGNNKLVGDFGFTDSGKSTETINSVTVQLYARQSLVDIDLEVFVWNGSVWTSLGVQTTPTSWDWMSWTASMELDTWTKIDGAKIYIESGPDVSEVDCARLQVECTPDNYELDLEVQWTSADFDETNEQLCIYGGTMGAENARVDVWNGSGWENLFPNLNSGWNNCSVSSYLDSSTFTIRFKGSIETGDAAQDTWNIDAVLLHTWTESRAQSFDWFTTLLLYILPLAFMLLFLLALKRKRRKTSKPHIEEKSDTFSKSFGMTHQKMIGKKMLLEIDPTSDFHKALSGFVSEARNSDELLFVLTNKTSSLHSAFSGDTNVNFLLLTSKTSSPKQINKNETLLPATDLSVLLDAFAKAQKIEPRKTINVLFDNLSDVILRCGFEKTYKFTRFLLESISSPEITAVFLFNPTAHEPNISSSIRGLFQIHLAYTKHGPNPKTSS